MASNSTYQVDRVACSRPSRSGRNPGARRSRVHDGRDQGVADAKSATRARTSATARIPHFPGSSPRSRSYSVSSRGRRRIRAAARSARQIALNDASFTFEPETSAALGFGFRCGSWGSPISRSSANGSTANSEIDLIATAPSVIYRIHMTAGSMVEMHNPADMPRSGQDRLPGRAVDKATILVPDEHLGSVPSSAKTAAASRSS